MKTTLMAGDIFPELTIETLEDGPQVLSNPQGESDWKMVIVYRGKHCPLCTHYINQLGEKQNEFLKLGVDIIAVSADSIEQATAHRQEMHIDFPIDYGLTVEQMKTLGLFISEPRSPNETDHIFAEPGLFLINEKKEIQVIDISNAPFSRPELNVLLSGIQFIRNPVNNYPIRGLFKN